MKTRKFARYPTDIPISISIDYMVDEHQLHLQDISQGGLCFNAHGCIDCDTYLNIVITFSGQSCDASGTIAWIKPLDSGKCRLGIKFENPVTQSEIEKLIDKD